MSLYLYIVFVFQFQCCKIDPTNIVLESFCYSDMDDTIVSFSTNYLEIYQMDPLYVIGVYGHFGGIKVCTDIK